MKFSLDKKKLMIIIWNMGIGGIQKRVKDIILDLNKNYPHWQVNLIIKTKNPNYFASSLSPLSKVKVNYFQNNKKRFTTIPFIFWLITKYKKIQPNVCLTFLDYLSIIMILIKKIIFWQKCQLVLNEGILTSKYLKIHRHCCWHKLVKIFYRYADKIIVPTKKCQNDLSQNFNVSEKKISVIPNWTLLKPLSLKKSNYDLIYIGRLDKEKGVLNLIILIKKLKKYYPNISLILLGEGGQLLKIKQKIKQLKLKSNIKIKGFTKNVSNFLTKSKIFVLSSYNEGMPNAVIEAAMCQVPTIALKQPGLSELIKHNKTGYLVKNQKQMVKIIRKLLNNNELRKKIAYKAQKHIIKNFSEANQKKFIDILIK